MPKQASKLFFSSFILFFSLANYRTISAKPSNQAYAPAASESENKSISSESLPAETLSPTYFPVPRTSSILVVETKSNQTLSQYNVPTIPNAYEPITDHLQITIAEENLSQDLASPPNTEPQNLPELNDYMSSLPKTAVPAPLRGTLIPRIRPHFPDYDSIKR